jgi:predicted esterase
MDGNPAGRFGIVCRAAAIILLFAAWSSHSSADTHEHPREPASSDGTEVVLCQASSHPIRYYLSLPKNYSRRDGNRWPTLVVIAGAGDDFRAAGERFRRARGERPFLVVCPCTFSSNNLLHGRVLERYRQLYSADVIQAAAGNGWCFDLNARLTWDEAGLCGILADLEASHDIEPRVYLTGFSAGGLLTYHMILNRPEKLAAAVPVCANFNFWDHNCLTPHRSPVGERDVPVLVIAGGRDPLRWYRFGGERLPSPLVAFGLLGCAVAVAGVFLWRRTRRAKTAVAMALVGVVLAALLVTNHGAGNEVQTSTALDLLRNSGYCRVERREIANLHHDPAAEHVFRLLSADLLTRP